MLAAADRPQPTVAQDWSVTAVPDTWDRDPRLKGQKGYVWYRCEVMVPQNWKGRGGTYLYVERVGSVCESFVNGTKVGISGALPPKYADGSKNFHRYVIPEKALKPGELNSVTIRMFDGDGQGGFLASRAAIDRGERGGLARRRMADANW